MLRGKHIVIGVTGGIAAYKAVYLLRELQQKGAVVRVIMTESATRFVGRDTFSSLTRHEVPLSIFPDDSGQISESWTKHIKWAEWADLMVVAPCTAHSLASIVHGFSNTMLYTTILAARCPVLLCPTMDGEMYQAPATLANLDRARELGFHLLPPEHGYLASGLEGQGRLPEPAVIMEQIQLLLEHSGAGVHPDPHSVLPLSGKKVLVTCGATREFFDTVRFLSNPSTGKMGMAMAEAAYALGAEVTLLHAATTDTSSMPEPVQKHAFVSTEDLFSLVKKISPETDIVIKTAAVSDFRPANIHPKKVKKDSADLQISLERTPDILQWLGENRKDNQVIIGFAMETGELAEHVRKKRMAKKADWIVGNDLSGPDSGFAVDTNRVLVIGPDSEVRFEGTKTDVARSVLHHIFVS